VSADKPSVAKVGDKYLLYYSMFKSAENSGIGVAVADLVTGPYVDQGKLLLASEYGITGVVSPSFFTDGTSNYLVFGNFGGIYIVELSEDGTGVATAPVKVASELFDAPCIMVKDGSYYMFASVGSTAGGADSSCQQVVGRADSVYGPYFDKSSKAMTDDGYEVLVKSSTKFAGPGHGTVFNAADGNTWIIYNAYDLSDVSKGRTLMLDRVNWNDGWPSVRGSIGSFSADAPALN
jgi:arabinan endo-1,5-alpha-L-arabinosidase